MLNNLSIEAFLAEAANSVVLDARSPKEYARGHIPGAVNFALFNDEERAAVGTSYKEEGKDAAVLLGLEFVGPKMKSFVVSAREQAVNNKVCLHCWRGGMRSSSLGWLLSTAGLEVFVLEGGYKAYRHQVLKQFEQEKRFHMLSGATGSGKTEVLLELRNLGEQVIDLEGLACHKGSAFGSLGEESQPQTEHFENLLCDQLQSFDAGKVIWLEDESRRIGSVILPEDLWHQIDSAPVFLLETDKPARIKRLVGMYGGFPKEELEISIKGIRKRLGGLRFKQANVALEEGDLETVAEICLQYYDKCYQFALERKDSSDKIDLVHIKWNNSAKETAQVLQQLNHQIVND